MNKKLVSFSAALSLAFVGIAPSFTSVSAETTKKTVLDFTQLGEQSFTTNTTTEYDIYEFHNANGDKISSDGIFFNATSVNTDNVNKFSNKRYILVKPEDDITLTIGVTGTYTGSGTSKYTSRTYIVDVTEAKKAGDAETAMSKSYTTGVGSTAGDKKLTKSNPTVSYTLSYNMTGGNTYAIYNYLYPETNGVNALITSMEYTKTYSAYFGDTKVSAGEGGTVTVPSPTGEQGKTILGWVNGDNYYYPGDSVCIDDIKGKTFTEVAYNTTVPVSFAYSSEIYESVILGETKGLTSGDANNTYTYDENGLYISVVTSPGDIITADNGINFKSPSFGESGTIESVGNKGRYILVKPSKNGKFSITGRFLNSGKNVGRIYYKDLGTEDVTTGTIYALEKNGSSMTMAAEADAAGEDASKLNKEGIEMTAGHTYVFAMYAKDTETSSFYITKMKYLTEDAVETPKPTDYPTPELQYMPEFSYEAIADSLITEENDDGSKASGFLAKFTATHGGEISKLNVTVDGDEKAAKKLDSSVILADGASAVFGVILDGVKASDTTVIDMKANESSLKGKTVYAFGDSIVYGHSDPDNAFMNLIAEKEGMTLKKYAQNGATIVKNNGKCVLNQVVNASEEEPDFVVFEGYTNDAYPETLEMGEITADGTTKFNLATYCGSFEQTIYNMKQKWPNAKYVYVTIHKSYGRDWNTLYDLREKSLEMCKKWGISVADVFAYTTMDTRDTAQQKAYLIGGAGSHPNKTACELFYVPLITQVMKAL